MNVTVVCAVPSECSKGHCKASPPAPTVHSTHCPLRTHTHYPTPTVTGLLHACANTTTMIDSDANVGSAYTFRAPTFYSYDPSMWLTILKCSFTASSRTQPNQVVTLAISCSMTSFHKFPISSTTQASSIRHMNMSGPPSWAACSRQCLVTYKNCCLKRNSETRSRQTSSGA